MVLPDRQRTIEQQLSYHYAGFRSEHQVLADEIMFLSPNCGAKTLSKEKAARISCENILAAFSLASQFQLIFYQFVVSTSLGCHAEE